ncbi:MAG: sulfurtransferase [Deltaproteobacteria bacterium]|nr:sulfurtransferase [Deltaproteobacteria bacterium]
MGMGQDMDGVQTLYSDEVQSFIREHSEGDYVLLDVRQPAEYAQAHLPGARLIPLPQLTDSLQELNVAKPIIVYCAVGGRSRMASQLLKNLGFKDVFHLQGGIQAWEDRTATGPREFHLNFIKGEESPDEIILLAYRMEEGLKKFHEAFQAKTDDAALSALLTGLIKAEESHEKTLLELRPKDRLALAFPAGEAPPERIGENSDTFGSRLMEGGIDMNAFMEENQQFLNDVPGYLDLAMMIETQALDLYLRMAADSKNELTRKILHRIGNEEKAHLELLGKYLNDNSSISDKPLEGRHNDDNGHA